MTEPKVVRYDICGDWDGKAVETESSDGKWVPYEWLREEMERRERIAFEAGYRHGRIQKEEGYATFYEGWQSSRVKEE